MTGTKPSTRVLEHDQSTVDERQRTEESGFGIRHRLDLAAWRLHSGRYSKRRCSSCCRRDSARRGENTKLSGTACPNANSDSGVASPASMRSSFHTRTYWLPLSSVIVADRSVPSGEMSRSEGTCSHGNVWISFQSVYGYGMRTRMATSVQMAHADERTVGRIEGELADARVLEQHPHLARTHVDGHEVAQRVVVVGVERSAACRIEGERRDHVVQRALDVGQPPHAAVARVERADVLDDAGIAECAVKDAGRLVVVHAGNGSERARASLRFGVIGNLRTSARLRRWNSCSNTIQSCQASSSGKPNTCLELVRVVARASFVASHPRDDLVGPVRIGEPREEARSVEVRVGAGLEVDHRAARHEPQRDRRNARRRGPSRETPSRRSRPVRGRGRPP